MVRLDYYNSSRAFRTKLTAVALAVAFGCLTISLIMGKVAYQHMDAQRLNWEGGHEYFRLNFPWKSVLCLLSIGVAAAVAGTLLSKQARWIPTIALVLNLLYLGFVLLR
jgi:xanthine/uracil permease